MLRIPLRRILAVGFGLLLVLPLLQMRFQLVREKPLVGVEVERAGCSPSLSAWLDGSIESHLDACLARNIGFRPTCVRLVNQLKLRCAVKASPTQQVIVAKENWLYESCYIRQFADPAAAMPEERLQRFVSQLKALQESLERSGKAMVFVISPSKAELYPEYLTDEVRRTRRGFIGRRDYDRLVQALEASDVAFVDSPRILREMKPKSEPLFAKTGTHWNYYSGFLIWREIVKLLNTRHHLKIPAPRLATVDYDSPRGTDIDLALLLNVMTAPGRSQPAPYPVVDVSPASLEMRPDFLFVGTSFSRTLIDSMYLSKSGRACEFLSYNRQRFVCIDEEPALPAGYAVPLEFRGVATKQTAADSLPGKEVVILETVECIVANGLWGFLEQALEAIEEQAPRSERATRPDLANQENGRQSSLRSAARAVRVE